MTARDDNGNIAVDFVWGNMPMQPNDDREPWANLSPLDNHAINGAEWSGFPAFQEGEGRTLEGGDAFWWPELWLCNYYELRSTLPSVEETIEYFVNCGVPRSYFVDFTFSGGETKWDTNGEPNWDGAIFYSYVPANESWDVDWQDVPIYGYQLDGKVVAGNQDGGYEDSVNSGYPEDYVIVVITNDPQKDNAGWWY